MKLVLSTVFFLATTLSGVVGGVIGDYGASGGDNGADDSHNDIGQSQDHLQNHQQDLGGHEGQAGLNGAGFPHGLVGQQLSGGGGDYDNHQQWQGGFAASYSPSQDLSDHNQGAPQQPEGHVDGDTDAYAQISQGAYGGHLDGQSPGQENLEGHGSSDGHNVESYGNHGIDGQAAGELASHGVQFGHGNLEHEQGHFDLQPKVEVQHHHIPTKKIEHEKLVPYEVVKKIAVPVPEPVGVPTAQVFKIPVPQPYAVRVPVPFPIAVPIYKLQPQEVEKKVPIEVQKLVPVYVEKPVKIEIEKHHIEYVDKPYPVHVPVYKHIFHHVPKHGHGHGH